MQHALAPSELWQARIAWRCLNGLGEAELEALCTKRLTYGDAPASNLKQDISWALMFIVIDLFDAEEAVLLSVPRQTRPGASTPRSGPGSPSRQAAARCASTRRASTQTTAVSRSLASTELCASSPRSLAPRDRRRVRGGRHPTLC